MVHKTRSVFFVLLRPAADGVQDASGGSLHFHVICRSARSPFAAHSRALSSLEKRPHFGVHFPDAKKGPKSANPHCCGSHLRGLFCAPKMGAKLAPPYGLNVARAWSPPARFCLCCRTCYPTCTACDCLCLPAFLSVSPGEALVCTPGLVACALHQSPLWHGACVVCTLWWP